MKEKIMRCALSQYSRIINEDHLFLTAQMHFYQLSMPLLALAAIHEKQHYRKIQDYMEHILNNCNNWEYEIPENVQLWILGRMLLAAKMQKDSIHFNKYKNQLAERLVKEHEKCVFIGWAYAYLALADKASYQANRQQLYYYAELARANFKQDKTKANDYVWTLVMNLFASSQAKDQEDYQLYLKMLRSLSKTSSLKEVVVLVPENDYRQWLVSIARTAFQFMQDKDSLTELPANYASEIESMDTMLAWANEINAFSKQDAYNSNRFQAFALDGKNEVKAEENFDSPKSRL